MNTRQRGLWTTSLAATLLIMVNTVASKEASVSLPTNHKPSVSTDQTDFKPSVNNTLLKMEARIDVEDGLDLMQFESNENLKKPVTVSLIKSTQLPSTKGVSYVTAISEPRISSSNSFSGSSERKGEVFKDDKKPEPVFAALPEDRGLRTTKLSGKDSYLDALAHSHTSKDQNEGIVHSDVRPKVPKIFRRDYHEGPVYRPDSDRYGAPSKSPSPVYGNPNYDSPSAPAPTESSFFPTPSNSYSLPEQSFDSFGPSMDYGSPQPSQGNPQPSYGSPQPSYESPQPSYESPQPSYGSPQPSYGSPQPSYGSPQPSYGAPPIPQSNYGVPSSSYGAPIPQTGYGPPSNSYLPPQAPQQGYGPPAPTYGAPYALPGMPSLPSLPMIDFTWPFALKLNAFTIAKIILKLVIFKMIVKFIAVICLLLFIPKLEITKKDEKQDDYEEGRGMTTSSGAADRLNFLTSMVMGSIEKHRNKNRKNGGLQDDCISFSYRLRKALTSGESWSDYIRLFRSYAVEEEQKVAENKRTEHRPKSS